MEISTLPANYQGAYTELVYGITGANPQQPVEVTIYGETVGIPLGIKRFRGADEYRVNIATYMRRQFDVAPRYAPQCGVYTPEGRIAEGTIRLGATESERRMFTAGTRTPAALELMSAAPLNGSIAPGELDEISVIAPAGSPLFFYGYLETADGGRDLAFSAAAGGTGRVLSLVVNMDSVEQWAWASGREGGLAAYERLVVCYQKGGALVTARSYALRPRSSAGVRLCWVNTYGAIDYYTFAVCRQRDVTAHKSRAYTADGFTVYGSQSEVAYRLVSDYEDAATMGWLAEIVNSPKVWISRCAEGYVPVDVVTQRTQILSDAPTAMTIEVRERKMTTFQNA